MKLIKAKCEMVASFWIGVPRDVIYIVKTVNTWPTANIINVQVKNPTWLFVDEGST